MAASANLIITLDLLSRYDEKIKNYVDTADSADKAALEALIGTIPASATEKDVVSYLTNYINAEVTAREGAVKGIEDLIGTVTTGKTVVEMIEDAKTDATYDDTAVKADIKANADAIDLLNDASTVAGSVANTVATEVAKIVAGADAKFDTLKEIADWIAADETRAAELTNKVSANETAIGTKKDASNPATGIYKALDDLDERIADVEADTTVADDLATLEGKLKALAYKDTIANADIAADAAIAQSKIDGLGTALAGKVDVETGKGLSANDFTDTYKGQLDGLSTALAAKQDVIPANTYDAYGSAEAVANKVGSIPTTATATTVIGYVDEKVAAVKGELVYATESDIDDLFKVTP